MNAKRMTRMLLSLVLVFSMVAGFVMIPANAAETGKTTFNYVSLGASNTNGYGMRGYITESELNDMLSGKVDKDDVNVYGYQRDPEGAYPDLIRDHYAGVYSNVNLDQLAISSMRVEELRVLLDDSYMGDDYTSWRFTGSDGWFMSAEPGGLSALRKAYTESITNADLITVDIGWNNFGVYVCNQLVDYMSNGSYKWTTDITSIYETAAEKEAAQEAKAIIGSYIEKNVGEGDMANALTDIFAYSILGYMHNFDICMEKIYEMNPDADVVVLGIQNLLYGVVVDIQDTKMPLGDIFGNFVNMANYYASACSPYHDDYLYVKAGSNEHVTIFLDYMKDYQGGLESAENLDQNVKDCFDYYDDALFIQTTIDYVAAALIEEEYGDMIGMIGYDSAEDVVADGKKGELGSLQKTFDSMYWPALYAAYDTLSVLVEEIANYASVDANGLLAGTVKISDVENALKEALKAEIQENALAAADGDAYTVDLNTLLPNANSKVVAAMYIRYYMGNSFFAHPNGTGHAEIKNAVLGVINNPASEKDQALSDYLIESVKQIHQLICGATGHEQIFSHTTAASCEDPAVTITSCACGKETTETTGEKLGHNYTAREPVWADDYTSCSITLTCERGCTETVTDNSITSKVTKEATCEEVGKIEYTADFSDSDVVEEAVTTVVDIPSPDHAYESVITPPTCDEDGYTTYTCSACGDSYVDDEVPALEHSWNEGEVTKEPTETETGIMTFTCTREGCGETKEETIPVLEPDHTHRYRTEVTAPSCEEAGYTTHTCFICGDSYTTDEVPALGHTEVTAERQEPTCTVDGHEEGTCCETCGKIFSGMAAIPATGHETETLEGKDPTCTEEGLTDGVGCTICGTVLTEQETIPALGHSWDEGVVTNEPTDHESGTRTYTCTRLDCEETKTEPIPALDHEHNYTSTVTAPTCTEKGYTTYSCTDCDDTYTADEVPALGHKYENGICTVCGAGNVARVYGNTRYETAYAVANELKAVLGVEKFDTIIVACGPNFPDALSGSYLAAIKDAPILLAKTNNDALLAYIQENLSDDGLVYILGSDVVVSKAFEDSLKAENIKVERLAGATRYLTNLAILEEAGITGNEMLISTSMNYADSLSASSTGLPILLINNSKKDLTTEQKQFLAQREDWKFYILGSEAAVCAEFEDVLGEYGEVVRVSGSVREETSIEIAKTFCPKPSSMALAFSQDFPDGLCGGVLAYNMNAPLILTRSSEKMEAMVSAYAEEAGVNNGIILGSSKLISDSTAKVMFHMADDAVIVEKN